MESPALQTVPRAAAQNSFTTNEVTNMNEVTTFQKRLIQLIYKRIRASMEIADASMVIEDFTTLDVHTSIITSQMELLDGLSIPRRIRDKAFEKEVRRPRYSTQLEKDSEVIVLAEIAEACK